MTVPLAPARLTAPPVLVGAGAVVAAALLSMSMGAVSVPPDRVLVELVDHLPGIDVDSGLSDRDAAIVWAIRFPRVVLGLLVGGMLGIAGAAYQGVFRNPLADPYLLGVGAGAGLGATIAIIGGAAVGSGFVDPVPLAAFAGALGAVALTYLLGASGRQRSPAALILAGVAVASFLTAWQTFLQQREVDSIRMVYSWILGRLSTSGWGEVQTIAPYVVVCTVVLVAFRRFLDVLSVGDTEATSLGLNVVRTRLLVVTVASLGTAAAVSVSGLIGFVGIIVPHTIRLLVGTSYRQIVPLSLLFGAAFMALADLTARTLLSPAEIPIGVVTAFCGAPFFVLVLRRSQRVVG